MNLLALVSQALTPITALIDELHTSDEEKAKVKNQLFLMQADLFTKTMEYEKSLMQAKADIVKAEAMGQSWLQRSWRPITMLTFLVLVVADSLALLPNRLAPEAWTLLQLGLGGYVVGRSAEKIAPHLRDMVGKPRD
jgi:hypothetical protein